MALYDALLPVIEKQGWTEITVLDLLMEYVDNQQDNDAVVEFFARAAEDENEEVV